MPDTLDADSRFPTHTLTRTDHYVRRVGLAAGAAAAGGLATMDSSLFGNDIAAALVYALTAFGLCAVAGVLAADALTPRPSAAVRTAGLAPRRVRDRVPRRMTPLLLFQAAALLVLLAIGAATAAPDALSRAGRAFTVTCGDLTETHSPWPGAFYATPVLVSLTLGTVGCAFALRRIARRPGDEAQRSRRSSAVTAAWGLLISSQLLGVDVMIAGTLTSMTCATTATTVAALATYPLGLLALITLAWCLITVVAPRAAARR